MIIFELLHSRQGSMSGGYTLLPAHHSPRTSPSSYLPNFLGSPHNADAVPESHESAVECVRNIERYLKREPLKGLAKRQDYEGLSRCTRRRIRQG